MPSAEKVSNFTCGNPSSEISSEMLAFNFGNKIIGGLGAIEGSFPWLAAMSAEINGRPFASAALISQGYAITNLANIYYIPEGGEIWLAFAQDDWNYNQEHTQHFKAANVFGHPEFESNTYKHDIALIEIDGYVHLNDLVSPICLPESRVNYDSESSIDNPEGSTMLFVAGWGSQIEGGGISQDLNYAVVKPINLEVCQHWYSQYGQVESTQMCAGYEDGGVDTCTGDGGSPLMSNVGGRWELNGLASWGVGCAQAGFPTVYTDVTAYLDLINEVSDLNDYDVIRPESEQEPSEITESESTEDEEEEETTPVNPVVVDDVDLTCTLTTSRDMTLQTTRIIGGQEAIHGAFPWQVSFSNRKGGSPFCGGSIISSKWVISAAHCFESDRKVWIGFGQNNWREETGHEQYLSSNRIICQRRTFTSRSRS